MTETLSLTPTQPADPALRARVGRCVFAPKADNTHRACTAAWREFDAFCRANSYTPLPASPDAVVDFITRLAEAGQKTATVQLKLAALSFTHEAARAHNPLKTPVVRATMAGIRRALGTFQQGKAPVLLSHLQVLVAHLDRGLRSRRDKALILLGWAGAFRRSELVALQVADVHRARRARPAPVRWAQLARGVRHPSRDQRRRRVANPGGHPTSFDASAALLHPRRRQRADGRHPHGVQEQPIA